MGASIFAILVLFSIGLNVLALCLLCFAVGAKARDVRWWFALSALWPDTVYFLDWDKIEESANSL